MTNQDYLKRFRWTFRHSSAFTGNDWSLLMAASMMMMILPIIIGGVKG